MLPSVTIASWTGKAKSPGTPKIASIPMSLRRRSTYSITVSDIGAPSLFDGSLAWATLGSWQAARSSAPLHQRRPDAGVIEVGLVGTEFNVGESTGGENKRPEWQ